MGSSKLSTWVAGAVVGALLIVAGGWLLLISPVLTTASETREAAVSTQDSNAMLQVKIKRLAAQFEELDVYKGELAALRLQVPTTGELASYLRQIDAVAAQHSVTITAVLPGTGAELVVDPATVAVASGGEVAELAAAPQPAAESADAEGEGEGETVTDAPATTGATAPAGLVAVPISITAMGTYDDMAAFLADIQGATERLFLITTITGSRLDDTVAAGGRPATTLGDMELNISGLVFVLPPTVTAPAEDPGALPAPIPGKNPLVPLG